MDGFMHCPECMVEYRVGFHTCSDCGGPLVPGPVPDRQPDASDSPASMQELLTTPDPLYADLVAATLREDDIETVVRIRFAGGLTLTPAETHWVPGQERIILVPSVALLRARSILASIEPPLSHAAEPGPGDSGVTIHGHRTRARVLAAIVLAPAAISVLYALYLAGQSLLARPERSETRDASARFSAPSNAVRRLRAACQRGNFGACVNLGVHYEKADGVDAHPIRAAALYRAGCDGEIAIGCVNLGLSYERGTGVSIDFAEARRLYEKGCDGRVMPGCFNLGTIYQRGVGVTADQARAAGLFRQACDGGYPRACVGLAHCYRKGTGVARSAEEAVRLYRLACDGGEMQGCYDLGVTYHTGEGSEANPTEAMRLYRRACDGGYREACGFVTR